MDTKQIDSLESYFKTENEHWNSQTFNMLAEIIEQGLFENPEQPLVVFDKVLEILLNNFKSPLKAILLFTDEMDKEGMNELQKLFLYEKVIAYLRNTDFGEKKDLSDVQEILKRTIKRLKAEVQPTKPIIKDIREHLKGIIQNEFVKLPEILQELEPMQRLNIICKLAPFVLPKVESIHSEKGEPEKNPFHNFEL